MTGQKKQRPVLHLLNWLLPVLSLFSGQVCISQTASSVEFTDVPAWGTFNQLKGKVHHTTLNDHGLAVYIFVEEAGGWWNKPYTADPVTLLSADSGFSAKIVVGGLDQFATRIIAFLIPLDFSPPILSGGELPETMFLNPNAVICRPHGNRIISWSGMDWTVKRSVGTPPLPIGPGPVIFSGHDSMVWVDDLQRLHLRIAKSGNVWHCSEIICNASLGYNRYTFDVDGRVDLLDPNVIAGIFTWDDCAPLAQPPDNYFREIDFEFSRWGIPYNENSQFVVQPYDIPGNMNRFSMDLSGIGHSVHSFDWKADSVVFKSSYGATSHSWNYLKTARIPHPGYENVRINLHLLSGNPPADNQPAEFILNSFVTHTSEPNPAGQHVTLYPNPVHQGCFIGIESVSSHIVEIGVADIHGNSIRTIYKGMLNTGSNTIEWNGTNENGAAVPPGFYLIFLRDPSEVRYFKLIKI